MNKQELIKNIKSLAREVSQEWPHEEMVELCDVLREISQLDEPELLSQEWVDEHSVAVAYDGMPDQTEIVYVDELEKLIVPKRELPVIPRFVSDWIEEIKPVKSLRVAFEYISQRKADNHDDPLVLWIEEGNSETFARAWLDGYAVEEEPLYYAWVKGHELITNDDTFKYWNFDTFNNGIFLSNRDFGHERYLTEMSKNDWGKLGINDTNADFVKVEE